MRVQNAGAAGGGDRAPDDGPIGRGGAAVISRLRVRLAPVRGRCPGPAQLVGFEFIVTVSLRGDTSIEVWIVAGWFEELAAHILRPRRTHSPRDELFCGRGRMRL